jgi:methionyl-tRNA synthetase
MPETAKKIRTQLGVCSDLGTWESALTYGAISEGTAVAKGEALFPRIDVEKELAALEKITAQKQPKQAPAPKTSGEETITIEDFKKIVLKTAKVTACENLEGSDKLLKLTVQCGGQARTIVSGIRESYAAEEMVGKTVVIVANLKPAKLRGVLSEGMLLAVGDNPGVALIGPDKDVPDGETVG